MTEIVHGTSVPSRSGFKWRALSVAAVASLAIIIFSALAALAPTPAAAACALSSTGNWSASVWTGCVATPPGSTDVVTFGGTNLTVTLTSSPTTVAGLGANTSDTIALGGFTLTLNNTSAMSSSVKFSGAGTLSEVGSAIQTLTGTTSGTWGVNVSGTGGISISAANQIGSGGISLSGGGILQFASSKSLSGRFI